MALALEKWLIQQSRWPQTGRHILAQYDERSVVVYQAYAPNIASYAVTHQRFGGEFKLGRMSWIKPNFLWMMYRSGWASKPGQDVVLAVRIHRSAFDEILKQAVHSVYVPAVYQSTDDWKHAVEQSDVRLQWDPDHALHGEPLQRRAIQLGLRRTPLASYATEWIINIEDVTPLVREQRALIDAGHDADVVIPTERVYPVTDAQTVHRLQLDAC